MIIDKTEQICWAFTEFISNSDWANQFCEPFKKRSH